MDSSAAELSSLATGLGDIARRVTSLADGYAAADRDDLAGELYEVERGLQAAQRRIERVLETEAGGAAS